MSLAVGLGEMAVVLGAHASLFLVNAGFLVLEVRGFAGGELAALDALSDAILLIVFALVESSCEVCAERAAVVSERVAIRASFVRFMMRLL